MSDYIIEAIKTGVLETLAMTFFSSVIAYIIGLPLGVLLYSTSKGRLLQNRPVSERVHVNGFRTSGRFAGRRTGGRVGRVAGGCSGRFRNCVGFGRVRFGRGRGGIGRILFAAAALGEQQCEEDADEDEEDDRPDQKGQPFFVLFLALTILFLIIHD